MQKFTVGYCEVIIPKSDIYITSSNNSEVETKNIKAKNFRGNSILWIWYGTGLHLVTVAALVTCIIPTQSWAIHSFIMQQQGPHEPSP